LQHNLFSIVYELKKEKNLYYYPTMVQKKIPYSIPMKHVQKILKDAYPKLKEVVYVDWKRKVYNGKKRILYLIST
jgi:hypothetical protein